MNELGFILKLLDLSSTTKKVWLILIKSLLNNLRELLDRLCIKILLFLTLFIDEQLPMAAPHLLLLSLKVCIAF